jgi:diacylglycerol kinase family enzyme
MCDFFLIHLFFCDLTFIRDGTIEVLEIDQLQNLEGHELVEHIINGSHPKQPIIDFNNANGCISRSFLNHINIVGDTC